MKKHICIILTLIILVCTIIATFSPSRVHNEIAESESSEKPTTETETINELTAFILDIDLTTGTLMVSSDFDTPAEKQIRVFLRKNTAFIIHGTASNLEDLSVGNQVSITYKGDIVKSDTNLIHYPLRIEIDGSHAKTYTETACILSVNYEDHSILIGPSKDAAPEEQKRIYIMDYTHIIGNGGSSSLLLFYVGEWISITYSDALDDTTPVQINTNVSITPDDTLREPVTITEYILDINTANNYLMIGPTMDTDWSSQTHVNIGDNTAILINDIPSKLEDLAIGNTVSITFDGIYYETAPAQIFGVIKIEVVE